jgi:hypothetical protein
MAGNMRPFSFSAFDFGLTRVKTGLPFVENSAFQQKPPRNSEEKIITFAPSKNKTYGIRFRHDPGFV